MQPLTWSEPEISPLEASYRKRLSFIGFGVSTVLIVLAIWLKQLQYGVGAVVALVASIALLAPTKFAAKSRAVQISESSLIIGNREYTLDLLAGFWVTAEDENSIITFEHKKPLAIPVTALFPGSPDTAAAALQPYLPELEPRASTGVERFTRFLRF